MVPVQKATKGINVFTPHTDLAYLEEEKIPPAIGTLQSLTNNPGAGTYKNKAEKILADI